MWPILTMIIEEEGDVIAVRQKARRVAELLGFEAQDQTRIATAVSEIARNAFGYGGGGRVELFLDGKVTPQAFKVRIIDQGPGVGDLEAVLDGRYRSATGLGVGITGARRLMDTFDINSEPGRGTVVTLGKLLPRAASPLAQPALAAIAGRLAHERAGDPMKALREQNLELIESMDLLRARDQELQKVNQELEATNRGVVALYAELDHRAERLRTSEERLSLALSSAEIGTWDYDPVAGQLRCDERCKELFRLSSDHVTPAAFLAALHPEDQNSTQAAVRHALDPLGAGTIDVEFRTSSSNDDKERWIAAKGRATVEEVEGYRRSVRLIGTAVDVSVHKQAAVLVKRAMEHQEVLIREVSHRVKNSLQLVASLLGLQARDADPVVRRAILDAQMRIGSVAQVHDHLWRQADVSIIDMAAFLRDLCENLQSTAPALHSLVCNAQSILLPTDRAIPVGLLVNELVTNAFKYAYPGVGGGEVCVTINASGEDRIRLEVYDQGIGLPEGVGLQAKGLKSNSLGMRLIRGFVSQLEGNLEVSSGNPGARFAVDMPLNGGLSKVRPSVTLS